jgi:hypothetical protein
VVEFGGAWPLSDSLGANTEWLGAVVRDSGKKNRKAGRPLQRLCELSPYPDDINTTTSTSDACFVPDGSEKDGKRVEKKQRNGQWLGDGHIQQSETDSDRGP